MAPGGGHGRGGTDSHSDWCDEPTCTCNPENFRANKIQWRGHMMVGIGVRMLAPRLSGLILHAAILVTYKCNNCGNEFRRTYEFTMKGKTARWGYYADFEDIYGSRDVSIPMQDVERVYDGMRGGGYDVLHYNCHRWTREFFNQVSSL